MTGLTIGKKLKLDYPVIDGQASQLLGRVKPKIPCADCKIGAGNSNFAGSRPMLMLQTSYKRPDLLGILTASNTLM